MICGVGFEGITLTLSVVPACSGGDQLEIVTYSASPRFAPPLQVLLELLPFLCEWLLLLLLYRRWFWCRVLEDDTIGMIMPMPIQKPQAFRVFFRFSSWYLFLVRLFSRRGP